jgi:hypothetical protein
MCDRASGKDDADNSNLDPFTPLFNNDFEPVATPIKSYQPPVTSPEILTLVEEFESQIEEIHGGTFPEWERFFQKAKKLEKEYFGDFGQSTALSDELMSVYELMDVEALYADDKFLAQLVKILPEDVHFACFLLNSEYTDRVPAISLTEMLNILLVSQTPMDCYGCAMNRWWGNPIAYLAVNPNTNSLDLQRIFEIAIIEPDEFSRDITLCSLAQNPSTPTEVIKQLASMDRDSLLAGDDQCPFYNPNNKLSVNISYWAKKQLDQRFSV